MALQPLKLPPGIYRNGTELDSAGRWYDANFVRWVEGVLVPIGGWQERSAAISLSGVARSMLTWRTNAGARWIGIGTNTKLYAINSSNTVEDITPVGFVTGNASATQLNGFGLGNYGSGYYGTPRPDSGIYLPPDTWMLDTWGEYLVGCATSDGKLYEWQLGSGVKAAQITNSPTNCSGLIVSNERALFALGANGNPRKVSWSDIENNTVWTAASTNNAGSQILQTPGKLMTARRVRGETLFLTDTDAHVATFVGQPYVYTFEKAGRACGAVSPNCIATLDNFAVWMGRNSFHIYDGYVRDIPCEVSDYVFSDINTDQIGKVYAVNVAEFSEVWWFYPSSDSNENDRYVLWNYKADYWSIGELARTAGTDSGVFKNPIMATVNGKLYDHELGLNYDNASVFVESGPVQIGNGDTVMYVNEIIPDEKNQGDVTLTFISKYYPNASENTYGPYSLTNPTSVRFNGRQVKMRINATPSNWRVGTQRLNVVPGGRR